MASEKPEKLSVTVDRPTPYTFGMHNQITITTPPRRTVLLRIRIRVGDER